MPKLNITEDEFYPHYLLRTEEEDAADVYKNADADYKIVVDDETLARWRAAYKNYFKVNGEIGTACAKQQRKNEAYRVLKAMFDHAHPSRSEKEYLLKRFGWVKTDTSEWSKDGTKLKLHEAYNLCKEAFERLDQWTIPTE